jgi:hypothetical protein
MPFNPHLNLNCLLYRHFKQDLSFCRKIRKPALMAGVARLQNLERLSLWGYAITAAEENDLLAANPNLAIVRLRVVEMAVPFGSSGNFSAPAEKHETDALNESTPSESGPAVQGKQDLTESSQMELDEEDKSQLMIVE